MHSSVDGTSTTPEAALTYALVGNCCERLVAEPLIEQYFHVDGEVASLFVGFHGSIFNFLPVGLSSVFWNDNVEAVRLIVSQRAGVDVGLIVHLLEGFLHLLPCRFRDVGTIVDNPVNGSNRDSSLQLCL